MMSHSRFTDEVYCTPVPGAAEIPVKPLEELKGEIFVSSRYADFQKQLVAAEQLNSQKLYEKYPPNFKDKNKRFIFDFVNKQRNYRPAPGKEILLTRWGPQQFDPSYGDLSSSPTKVHFKDDVFTYDAPSDNQTVEWYLNFANADIFAYYAGPLLAQDELQVMECVELASVREYLVQTTSKIDSRTVIRHDVPTPILLSNVDRVVRLNTRDIYGNAFTKATERQLMGASHYFDTPQIVNLIAIEAPSHGKGAYTSEQIYYILLTCYTGFKAAQVLADKTYALNKYNQRRPSRGADRGLRTVIHTGWWGCGAYGNNRQMMLITQIIAANWAKIDEITFHTQTKDFQSDVDEAQAFVKTLHGKETTKEIVQEIVNKNFQWEVSNNT